MNELKLGNEDNFMRCIRYLKATTLMAMEIAESDPQKLTRLREILWRINTFEDLKQ